MLYDISQGYVAKL